MNNVFDSELAVHRIFDLKGSTAGRKATAQEKREGGRGVVYKDIDWVEQKLRIACGRDRRAKLCEQLAKDCGFLRDRGIMDYSLLVGVHFEGVSFAGNNGDMRVPAHHAVCVRAVAPFSKQ